MEGGKELAVENLTDLCWNSTMRHPLGAVGAAQWFVRKQTATKCAIAPKELARGYTVKGAVKDLKMLLLVSKSCWKWLTQFAPEL